MANDKKSSDGSKGTNNRLKELLKRRSAGADDEKLLKFVAQIEKKARSADYPQEVRSFYAEIADTLTEGFGEYNPEQLPQYQNKLKEIRKLSDKESILDFPEFKEDVDTAIALMDDQIRARFGTIEKLKRLGSLTGSALSQIHPAFEEFSSIMQDSFGLGQKIGRLFQGKATISNEEKKRHFDFLNPDSQNAAQNQQALPNAPRMLPLPLLGASSGGTTPVLDEKVLSSNTKQNSVLTDLVKVSKDTNRDIKIIKNVILQDASSNKFEHKRKVFSDLETQLEREPSTPTGADGDTSLMPVVRSSRDLMKGAADSDGDSTSALGGIISVLGDLVTGYALGGALGKVGGLKGALKKGGSLLARGAKWIGGAAKAAAPAAMTLGRGLLTGAGAVGRFAVSGAGTLGRAAMVAAPAIGSTLAAGVSAIGPIVASVVSSPIVLAALAAVAGVLIGRKLSEWIGPSISKLLDKATSSISRKIKSMLTTVGETVRSLDYYRELLTDDKLSPDDLAAAEQRAKEFLDSEAKEKRELYEKTYANDFSGIGTGDYRVNGKKANRAEALADVEAAEKKLSDFSDYLTAKQEKGGGQLRGTARFKHNGKVYSNPLYTADEQKQIEHTKGRVANFIPSSLSQSSIATDDVDVMMRAIAEAETGGKNAANMWDESRFIRTEAGSKSSAYGPLQITYSRAQGDLKRGLFKSNPELEKWVRERFIPQGKYMLRSSYSDPTYGAGGKGHLSGAEDRDMYRQMSRAMIGDTLEKYEGDVLQTAGDWRFGAGKRNQLLSNDRRYARVVENIATKESQLMLENNKTVAQVTAADIVPAPQAPKQQALDTLTKEAQAQANQPIVITQPAPVPDMTSITPNNAKGTRLTGAPSSGAAEPSFNLANRHNYSPI